MDSTSRRPQLPALSYLDVDQTKREEDAYPSRDSFGIQKHSSAAVASPIHPYPSGPPPPYTHSATHANTWPSTNSSVHTPPDSRRTSGDEHEGTKQTTRQSLPSISEALGPGPLDGQPSYPPPTSAPQAPPAPSTQLPTPQSGTPRSPQSATRRSYPMEPPQGQAHQYSLFRQDSAGPQTYASSDHAKSAYGPPADARQPTNGQSAPPPPRTQPPSAYPYPQTSSSQYEGSKSSATSSMPPPPATFAYGYTPYAPRYAQPNPSSNSGPVYQPTTQYATPPSSTPNWKSESSRYSDERVPAPYGDSVKRHLEMYDLEASLNEIQHVSAIVMDFTRRYGERSHQSARSGLSLSSLPSPVEVEDMIQKSRIQVDSLIKIRDVILSEQAAYEQQLADQRHKAFAEPQPPAQDQHGDGEEGKGGFNGAETKKRRGRAAPPGRCHSCNRAETPEWRRGPDGARTLCNACGLHYAKLTRKQTTGNKNGNVGSSTLRPKEA